MIWCIYGLAVFGALVAVAAFYDSVRWAIWWLRRKYQADRQACNSTAQAKLRGRAETIRRLLAERAEQANFMQAIQEVLERLIRALRSLGIGD